MPLIKLSATLRQLLDEHLDQPLVLGTLLQQTGEQGFGIILGLLTLPMVIPLPVPLAGFSTLMGARVALIGLQSHNGGKALSALQGLSGSCYANLFGFMG
ncbi:MAG: exopolysaccharide biosynthesis protein [Thermosynechococcaceae cyanobacterium]